jgi:hypothetical protein
MHLEPTSFLKFYWCIQICESQENSFCEFQLCFENKDQSYIFKVPPYCLAKYTLICLDPNQFLSYFNWTWSKELKIIWITKHNWISKQNSHWQVKILKICLTKCINLFAYKHRIGNQKPNCWSNSRLFSLNFLISKNWRISSEN